MDDPRQHLVPAIPRLTDLVVARGEGPYLFDASGRRYLDFTSGFGVNNTGHCHPRVVAAVQEQAARLLHAHPTVACHEPMLSLIDHLMPLVPDTLRSFFFANSGAEAVEAAIKLARRATRRANVIVFEGGFHGRTLGAISLTTSKSLYRAGYQPLLAGVHVAPYPYAYRYGWSAEETLAWCLRELRHLLETQTAPDDTAAVLVEPVLGEGGYVVPPAGFLPALRDVCDEHGLLLIADEVQTGFGRTGRFFALEHSGARPDILIMAKGMASGLPVSGIATREDVAQHWPPASHGSTFGGNAVACAAAVATVQVIQDEGLLDNAQKMGGRLIEALSGLQRRHDAIADVRGIGLMIGAELRDVGGESAGQVAKAIQKACLERGLLLLTCGTRDQVIRWIPPLVVGDEHMDDALEIFEAAVARVHG
jgi:4-aminobutyrate aminotransferase